MAASLLLPSYPLLPRITEEVTQRSLASGKTPRNQERCFGVLCQPDFCEHKAGLICDVCAALVVHADLSNTWYTYLSYTCTSYCNKDYLKEK